MRARAFDAVLPVLVALVSAACGGGDQREEAREEQREAQAPAAEQAPAAAPAAEGAAADTIFNVDPNNPQAALRWDPATKTMTYPLVSGLTSNAGGWNFNGWARGQATIVVPVGAKVYMPYLNLDVVPHSVGVVTGTADAIPAAPAEPVFNGAITEQFQTGLFTNKKSDMRFTADKPGRYILICGVPGHGTSGMWIWFEVSESVTAPEIRTS